MIVLKILFWILFWIWVVGNGILLIGYAIDRDLKKSLKELAEHIKEDGITIGNLLLFVLFPSVCIALIFAILITWDRLCKKIDTILSKRIWSGTKKKPVIEIMEDMED